MILLRDSIMVLQYCGIWPPAHLERESWKSWAYSGYTLFVMFIMYSFTSAAMINLIVTTDDIANFSDSCFMLLSMLATSCKALVIVLKGSEIRRILRDLDHFPHKPINYEEQAVQDEFDGKIRFLTLLYGITTAVTVWSMTIFTFFQDIPFGTLPYKAWIPYDYSQPRIYWITYFQQLLSVVLGAHLNIGFDTIIPGFFLQICAQFNILKCKLRQTINNYDDMQCLSEKCAPGSLKIHEYHLVECIKYHCAIYDVASQLNSLFTNIIFVQYAASSIVICVSVFLISQMSLLSPRVLGLMLYLTCMLLQIFMFCATGNEATLQCQSIANCIFSTKWYGTSSRMKQYLGLMMVRTMRPVKFVSGFIIVLSLDSFCILDLQYGETSSKTRCAGTIRIQVLFQPQLLDSTERLL